MAAYDANGPAREAASYWGKASANIDWCEFNYTVTSMIAEFWNCVSNLLFIAVGLLGFFSAWREGLERRFLLAHLLTALIGLGSSLFHATLQFRFQLLDEIPMFIAVLVYIFQLLPRPGPYAAAALAVYAGAWTAAAVSLAREHAVVFQLHFAALVVVVGALVHARLPVWGHPAARGALHRAIFFGLAGVCCWALDRCLCERINTHLPINPQLHAVWHLCMALHLANLNAFLGVELARGRGRPASLHYLLPAIPFVRIARPASALC